MKGIPEELLYVLIFMAVMLFQYLTRVGAKAPEEPARDEDLSQILEEAEDTPAASALSGVVDDVSGRPDAPVVVPVRQRFSRSSLMGSRRAVQNAVVVATILGPCRAFEPHDVRQ